MKYCLWNFGPIWKGFFRSQTCSCHLNYRWNSQASNVSPKDLAPSQDAIVANEGLWEIPIKHVIILVVTVAERGPHPMYHLIFFTNFRNTNSRKAEVGEFCFHSLPFFEAFRWARMPYSSHLTRWIVRKWGDISPQFYPLIFGHFIGAIAICHLHLLRILVGHLQPTDFWSWESPQVKIFPPERWHLSAVPPPEANLSSRSRTPERIDSIRSSYAGINYSSWWFQPLWKILVKLDHFPR